MTNYSPKIIGENITLPKELEPLVEQLAEAVHDTWSAGRFAAGWVYGATRNDELKTHPDLCPFCELTCEEQAYDRNTATTTLKQLVALGWQIVPPQE